MFAHCKRPAPPMADGRWPMNLDRAYSRPKKTADQLGEVAQDRHRFLNKHVLLTGEAEILRTANGKSCFLDSLRLLPRICPNISVALPDSCGTLYEAATLLSRRIAFGREVQFLGEIPDMREFDAILSVGSVVRPELPWTTVNSNGWLMRVSSADKNISGECGQVNPIASLGAASLGVGDVFKRLIRLKGERGELLNGLSYSLRTYSAALEQYGPELPRHLRSDLLVVGAGAIGNGLVHLIAELPFRGAVGIVDSQEYQTENLGTCILIGPSDLSRSKAETLANHLRQVGIDGRDFRLTVEQYIKEVQGAPLIIINGLDNIDARHDVQRGLWPDVLIDGAIGDFTCQVSRHPWSSDIACLMCLFKKTQTESAETLQRKATGLSLDRLADPKAVVSQSDVENAPRERKEFLRARIGRTFCSVIQEAMARQISDERQAEGFEPSAPFVACFSACMVMSEVVAYICEWPSALAPRFQFDFLRGPTHGQMLPQDRRSECVCARRKNIERLREERRAKAASRHGS